MMVTAKVPGPPYDARLVNNALSIGAAENQADLT
jgi:hypothetical protein